MRFHVPLFGIVLAVMLGAESLAQPGPWARTEIREDCAHFDGLRNPYFGETHVHTVYSTDAVVNGTKNDPRDAYRFAAGSPLPFTPGNARATQQLQRNLDFAIVTDHAEFFGETSICLTPSRSGYNSPECVELRGDIGVQFPAPLDSPSFLTFFFPTNTPNTPRFDFCGENGALCLGVTSLIWQDTQDAAEEFYDRTAACGLTTFVGYEWSAATGFRNLHRNVIFRNEIVPALPTSYFEEPTAQGLWTALKDGCIDSPSLEGCDVLAIPHNSNISGGGIFFPAESADSAKLRASMEPVVELTQHKADSECHPLFSSSDELCGFEKLTIGSLLPSSSPVPLNFVRNVLLDGLAQEEELGVNPFKFGVIGSTDGHMAMSGATREDDFGGHVGSFDDTPEQRLIANDAFHAGASPGGLAVVWAEENSRDALFAAMRRREVYSTSGTRPIVRFFAGRLPRNLCGKSDFVETGYAQGVPMGGDLGPVRSSNSPQFAVLAMKDPGPEGRPGTPLQRVQIIKGWIDANGNPAEKVYDVAGDPNNGASVDTATCETQGTGADSLCAVWEDPDFDPAERAFFYVRVVENPTCRWSQYLCNDLGVDCADPESVPDEFRLCCDDAVPDVIQERAVTSPIFYRPEGVAKLKGRVQYGPVRDANVLKLNVTLGAIPDDFDPSQNDLTIRVSDDDEVYAVTIPAGTMRQSGSKGFVYRDPAGSLAGLDKATVKFTRGGELRLRLRTVPMALAAMDRTDHMVDIEIRIGNYTARHSRRWASRLNRVFTPS